MELKVTEAMTVFGSGMETSTSLCVVQDHIRRAGVTAPPKNDVPKYQTYEVALIKKFAHTSNPPVCCWDRWRHP